jgi:uncharacterized protein (DUF1015 family)
MATLRSFRALRPRPADAARIAAVPYDVVSTDEARALADGNPLSFLRVSRAEIEFPAGADPHTPEVYDRAAANFAALRASSMELEAEPALYLYRLRMGDHQQTGLAGCFSLDEYDRNIIRKHERTRRDKEDDRTRHMLALRAQTGPVFLTYRGSADVDAIAARNVERAALFDFTAPDDVQHTLWAVTGRDRGALVDAFACIPALYIADGHHRSAAAARVAQSRGNGAGSHRDFLTVIFPDHEMTILDYNRLLKDLNGRTPEQLLAELRSRCAVTASDAPVRPALASQFGMYLAGRWYKLTLRDDLVPKGDPIGRLPITLLARNVIEPLFGISDPRTDKRIDFVGGGRGLGELERRVASGEMAVAFALYPTQMGDLMAVADAGGIMPPKSTWFEPKLADGMVNHVLD